MIYFSFAYLVLSHVLGHGAADDETQYTGGGTSKTVRPTRRLGNPLPTQTYEQHCDQTDCSVLWY